VENNHRAEGVFVSVAEMLPNTGEAVVAVRNDGCWGVGYYTKNLGWCIGDIIDPKERCGCVAPSGVNQNVVRWMRVGSGDEEHVG